MRHPLLAPDLRELIAAHDAESLRDFFNNHHAASAAEMLEDLRPEEVLYVLHLLDPRPRCEVFSYLDPVMQEGVVSIMDQASVAALLTDMRHDERANLVKRLPPARTEQILPLLAHVEREDIRRLSSYQARTAGAVMTSDYASLPPDITVHDAIERLRLVAPQREMIYYCYIVDAQRKLLGMVTLTELILASPHKRLSEIMRQEVVSARVDDDQEKVARMLMDYDVLAIPVVDADNRLVGMVTHDDVADVMVQEATEDAQRMAAVGSMSDNYLEISFVTIWRKRAVWLSCLFVAELFTFTALSSFEDEIGKVVALSLFVPLCISTGGNSGSQAATLITRAMALGHVTPKDWWRVIRHELAMGVALGLTLGVIGFVRASLTPASVLGDADRWMMALVIGQSVAAICLWGTLIGSILPMIFRRLGFDPAYASSPFVATFVDVTGIVIYFSIAKVFLAAQLGA